MMSQEAIDQSVAYMMRVMEDSQNIAMDRKSLLRTISAAMSVLLEINCTPRQIFWALQNYQEHNPIKEPTP